jgi:hypothetical protein
LSQHQRALYDEVEATKTMLDRTERRLNLKPRRLAADTAYGTSRFLGWLVGRKIALHIPVRDAERDDGTFSRSDFRWDRRKDVYVCPNNKVLHTTFAYHFWPCIPPISFNSGASTKPRSAFITNLSAT